MVPIHPVPDSRLPIYVVSALKTIIHRRLPHTIRLRSLIHPPPPRRDPRHRDLASDATRTTPIRPRGWRRPSARHHLQHAVCASASSEPVSTLMLLAATRSRGKVLDKMFTKRYLRHRCSRQQRQQQHIAIVWLARSRQGHDFSTSDLSSTTQIETQWATEKKELTGIPKERAESFACGLLYLRRDAEDLVRGWDLRHVLRSFFCFHTYFGVWMSDCRAASISF